MIMIIIAIVIVSVSVIVIVISIKITISSIVIGLKNCYFRAELRRPEGPPSGAP